MEELDKQVENKVERDEKGRLLPGSTANPHGRPKGKTMKEFVADKFRYMSDEDKELWLAEHKVGGIDQWKMGEGQPKQDTEISGELGIKKVISTDEWAWRT